MPFRFFFIFAAFTLIQFEALAQTLKPRLNIVSIAHKNYANSDGSGYYWDMMRDIFGKNYRLNIRTLPRHEALLAFENKSADIIIDEANNTTANTLVSSQHINTTYPIYAIFDGSRFQIENITDLSHLLIAAESEVTTVDFLPDSARIYKSESAINIQKLINNQRADVALVHSYNVKLVDNVGQYQYKKLLSAKKIFLQFHDSVTGSVLRKIFDDGVAELINNNQISNYFSSTTDYEYAKLNSNDHLQNIDWRLMPKQYNPDTKRLEVVEFDRQTSNYIHQLLPEYNFSLKVSSASSIDNALLTTDNTCAISLSNKNNRENTLVMSVPTDGFIPPRLFMLKESYQQKLAIGQLSSSGISISELLENSSDFVLAMSKQDALYKDLNKVLSYATWKRIHAINDLSHRNVISMLYSGYIDGIIAWPAVIHSAIGSSHDINKLTSMPFTESKAKPVSTYIVCSKSVLGETIVEKINALIRKPKHEHAIYKPIVNKMDEGSIDAYKTLLKLTFE